MHKKHTYTFHDEIEVNASQVSVLSPWGLIFLCALQFDLMEIGKLSFHVLWALLIVNLIASFINILSSCHPLQSVPSQSPTFWLLSKVFLVTLVWSILTTFAFQPLLVYIHHQHFIWFWFSKLFVHLLLHTTSSKMSCPMYLTSSFCSHGWPCFTSTQHSYLVFFLTYLCCCGIFMLISNYIET